MGPGEGFFFARRINSISVQALGRRTWDRTLDIYDGALSDKAREVSGSRVGRIVPHFIGPPNRPEV